MTHCNICGNLVFSNFNTRKQVFCLSCKSLERHRLVRWSLESLGVTVQNKTNGRRALHLAPEESIHRYLAPIFGGGYFCSDLFPEIYPHARCLKLALPEGFDIFPDGYFNLIVHNHVLEHIPGDYRDHLTSFLRLLNHDSHMIFTTPPISLTSETKQGGELLASDPERIRLFGQKDHYKRFGYDLLEWFQAMPGYFKAIDIPLEVRNDIRGGNESVFVYTSPKSEVQNYPVESF